MLREQFGEEMMEEIICSSIIRDEKIVTELKSPSN
jgi:hypothetical protein